MTALRHVVCGLVFNAYKMAPKTRSADPRKPSRGKHAWTIREEEYLAELYEQETFIYDFGPM